MVMVKQSVLLTDNILSGSRVYKNILRNRRGQHLYASVKVIKVLWNSYKYYSLVRKNSFVCDPTILKNANWYILLVPPKCSVKTQVRTRYEHIQPFEASGSCVFWFQVSCTPSSFILSDFFLLSV